MSELNDCMLGKGMCEVTKCGCRDPVVMEGIFGISNSMLVNLGFPQILGVYLEFYLYNTK